MNRAERYREHAKECLAFSTSVADPMWRAQLLSVAAQWHELAQCEIARNVQQALVDPPLVENPGAAPGCASWQLAFVQEGSSLKPSSADGPPRGADG
jgi:hypothetical protein